MCHSSPIVSDSSGPAADGEFGGETGAPNGEEFRGQSLAFGLNIKHSAPAIYVLACLLTTRPVPGRMIQDIPHYQVVRYRARIARGVLLMEAKYGYRNC